MSKLRRNLEDVIHNDEFFECPIHQERLPGMCSPAEDYLDEYAHLSSALSTRAALLGEIVMPDSNRKVAALVRRRYGFKGSKTQVLEKLTHHIVGILQSQDTRYFAAYPAALRLRVRKELKFRAQKP